MSWNFYPQQIFHEPKVISVSIICRIPPGKQWLVCWTSMVSRFSTWTGEITHRWTDSSRAIVWNEESHPESACDVFFQLRAVLHQLLQWEAAAAFHPAHPQVWAGGVRDGGDWSNHSLYILDFSGNISAKMNSHTLKTTSQLLAWFFFYLQWEPVPYFNNKIICDLVEEKHRGIIALLVKIWFCSGPTWRQAILSPTKLQQDWIIDSSPLIKDEECLRPGEATDLTLLEKMEEEIGGHPHFVTWVGNFCSALCPSDQTGTSHDHKHTLKSALTFPFLQT